MPEAWLRPTFTHDAMDTLLLVCLSAHGIASIVLRAEDVRQAE